MLIGYGADSYQYEIWDFKSQKALWVRDIKILEGTYININISQNERLDNGIKNTDDENINKSVNASENNDNHNGELTNTQSTIITRSHLNNLSFNNSFIPMKISVEIPRKPKEYYEQFEHIYNTSAGDNMDIYLIKSSNNEPSTYNQAINGPDNQKWLDAMRKEVDELEDKNTWELVDLPPDKKALGGRWVYKIKTNSQNNIIKYKARWVVQGFNQIAGIDYLETFSTVCRPETYRLFFIIALANNWHILQFDVKNAFVHTDIDIKTYIIPPIGFYNNKNKVCKLRKALYGLKQSPRLWYKFLSSILYKLGFRTFLYDDGAFINPSI